MTSAPKKNSLEIYDDVPVWGGNRARNSILSTIRVRSVESCFYVSF